MFSFHVVSPPQPCMHLSSPPLQALCPTHLILDLITWTYDEEFTSQCSSLCSFKYVQSSSNFFHVHYLSWSFQLVLGLPHNYSNSQFFLIFKGIIVWGYNTSSFPVCLLFRTQTFHPGGSFQLLKCQGFCLFFIS